MDVDIQNGHAPVDRRQLWFLRLPLDFSRAEALVFSGLRRCANAVNWFTLQSAQQVFGDPGQRSLTVTLVLDLVSCNGEEMHLAIGWIGKFQRQKVFPDGAAGNISAFFDSAIRAGGFGGGHNVHFIRSRPVDMKFQHPFIIDLFRANFSLTRPSASVLCGPGVITCKHTEEAASMQWQKIKSLVGMRILKTAIAVGVCVGISQALNLEYPFYAAIAAIISMESSLTMSFKAGRNRMLGTLVGALVGLAFASIAPNNAILCGVGTVIIIAILNYFNWNSSISIAGIVFIAIMVNLNGRSPLLYGANRILDTAIGISVALIVNYLVFPHRIDAEFELRYRQLHDQTLRMVEQTVCARCPGDPLELEKNIADLTQQIHLHAADLKIRTHNRIELETLQQDLSRFKHICTHLAVLAELQPDSALTCENRDQVSRYFPDADLILASQGQPANPIYNYHVGRILQLLPPAAAA